MTGAGTEDVFASFLALPERNKRDIFAFAARRLDTMPGHVEKDFWVCLVLNMLFDRLPASHPKLLFKGGTSLSKVFGLIRRFSEDIDLVVARDGLGFASDHDPTIATGLSNKRRSALAVGGSGAGLRPLCPGRSEDRSDGGGRRDEGGMRP